MSQEIENGVELSHVNGANEKNEEIPKTIQVISYAERIKKIFNFFTVEPFLFCYVLGSAFSGAAVQQLNVDKACRSDLNYSDFICDQVISGDFNDTLIETASNEARVMVANMIAWQQPIQSGIPAIAILFVGAWSDRTGNRKALMLTPVVGEFISATGLILATYFYLEWPLWATALIEVIPTAFSGGLSIALMGSISYIADATTVESRTFRVGVISVIVTLGIPVGFALSGVLTETIGYYGIFGINAMLYFIGFVYTYFKIHDINRKPTDGTFLDKLKLFFNPINAWSTLSLLFTSREMLLIRVWLVILVHIIVIGPVTGEAPIQFLYVLGKYGMDVVDYSLFVMYSTMMGLTGTLIAVTVFSKYLGMHDCIIGVIATTFKVMGSLVYGLAPNRNWFFSGPVFEIFGNSGTTVVRSMGTKVVSPDQVGQMCSLIGFVEAMLPVIYAPLYSQLYSNYSVTIPGLFYIVGACMTAPAIFIFLYMYKMHKNEQRDVVENPDTKEIHAHENYVSEL